MKNQDPRKKATQKNRHHSSEAWQTFLTQLSSAEDAEGHTSNVARMIGVWRPIMEQLQHQDATIAKQQAGWAAGGQKSAEMAWEKNADRNEKIRDEWQCIRPYHKSDYETDKEVGRRFGLSRQRVYMIRNPRKSRKR